MSKKSPNRRPAYGGNGSMWLGGCYQQYNKDAAGIQILQNTTKVPTYLSTGDSVIDPYARPNISISTPSCSPYYLGVCGDGINEEKYCNVPTASDVSDLGQASFPVGIYHNNYTSSNVTTSLASCHSVGFKNVYAYKTWLGKKQYDSRELNQSDEFDWCGPTCEYHTLDPEPDTTRYLGMSATYTWESVRTTYTVTDNPCSIDCGGGPVDYVYQTYSDPVVTTFTKTANNTIQLNRYSGNLTVSACSSGSTGYPVDEAEAAAAEAWTKLADVNTDATALLNTYYAILIDINTALYPPTRIEGSPGNWQLYWDSTNDYLDECGNTIGTETWVSREIIIDRTHLSHRQWASTGRNVHNCGAFCNGQCTKYLVDDEHWTFTSNTYTHYKQHTIDPDTFPMVVTETTTGYLFAPYSSAQCLQDAEALLGKWDLGDDTMYPWRVDGNVNKGPLLYYDEATDQNLLVPQCADAGIATGAIFGEPAPKGIDRVWNPAHKNYCICSYINQDLETCTVIYIKDYGAWSDTSINVPRATAWINDQDANRLPQGAFILHNRLETTPSTCATIGQAPLMDDKIWVCKYAEVIIPKPSINFARYCGEDRFLLSQSLERCISEVADKVLTIDPAQPDLGYGEKVWVGGTGTVDGLWKATRDTDHQLTLTDCLVSSSALPSVPVTATGPMVCQVKFQDAIPGICGRVDIVSATKSTPITCSLMEPQWLLTDDDVFIVNANGGNINGHWQVNVIDASTIALVGSNGVSASTYIPNSGQMYSAFAADWKWNDSQPKGNYTTITWDFNFRDVGEYLRLSSSVANPSVYCDMDASGSPVPCAPYSIPPEPRPYSAGCGMDQYVEKVECLTHMANYNTCRPVVAYFAPTGQDTFNTGSVLSAINHGFGDFKADSIYGAAWQGIIKQTMDDPFWQAPPCQCNVVEGDILCESGMMDTGDCTGDYPLTPQVEPMAAIPEGAPPLPPGKYLGCLTVEQMADNCPEGNICAAPYADSTNYPIDGCGGYTPQPYATPWITYLNQLNCVCDAGAFALEYQEQGIICDDDFLVPAP